MFDINNEYYYHRRQRKQLISPQKYKYNFLNINQEKIPRPCLLLWLNNYNLKTITLKNLINTNGYNLEDKLILSHKLVH